jgi:hypothetical protein
MPEEPTTKQMEMINSFRERVSLAGFVVKLVKPVPSKDRDYRVDRWDVHITWKDNEAYTGCGASYSLVKAVRQACTMIVALVESDKSNSTPRNVELRKAKLKLHCECQRLLLCDEAPDRAATDYHTPRLMSDPYS